ncbi:hypothetical protein FNU76_16140 [Chitinimonas arctica]|uniref:Porin n=1 Tax=Chitinimonas arctica TaxID=2594795 RepID=A0A516SHZ3_9NEIS|nr:hypothetical protein [Chitinimonas arctica]QDQ27755.1 hypothetical protein FNU76_16140 [Chitinimonas arctica]
MWLLVLALHGLAHADEPTTAWKFSGFGTLGLTQHNSDHASYRSNAQQANGIANEWSLKNDTVLGVQTRYQASDTVDFTLQLLSRHGPRNNFDPQVDWAYMAWHVTPSLNLRAGRFIAPVLMASDYRNVNYSNPWIRPPLEVYGLLTLNNVDGIDAIYRGSLGKLTYALQPFLGQFKLPLGAGRSIHYHRMRGINSSLQAEDWMFRLAYMKSDHSLVDEFGIPYRVLRSQIAAPACGLAGRPGPGCETVYPGYAAVAQALDVEHKRSNVLAVGGSYDDGDWVVQGEFVRRMAGSVVASGQSWYVGAGRRIGEWMPYAVLARHWADTQQYVLKPAAAYAGRPDRVVRNSSTDQSSISIGLRRELGRNLAIKGQIDWLKPEPGRYGGTFGNGNLFPNVPPPTGKFLSEYGAIRVMTVSLDFMF